MKNIETLDEVELNREVQVKKVNCSSNIKRRILDLGMVEGTKIKPVFKSPLGDPTAYEVRGSLISLRKEESRNIEIER